MERLLGENLSYRYDERLVVNDVTVVVTPGRAAALVGESGTGKSTLLWLLAGLHQPLSGRRRVEGADGAVGPIGMVFQQPGLWDHLTVRDHLKLVLAGKGLSRGQRRTRVDAALAQMRLAPLQRRRPGQLSGGERQRVTIARALVVRPRWLLLDEPLAHLDGAARADLFALLSDALHKTNAGVLLATHNTAEALRIADDVIIMIDGRIAQQGPTARVYNARADLQTARVLGPAGELAGVATNGSLLAGGRPLLEGLDPSLAGPQRLILRPHMLRFITDPDGPAAVTRCEFTGAAWQLHVTAGDISLAVRAEAPLPPGTTGRLRAARSTITTHA